MPSCYWTISALALGHALNGPHLALYANCSRIADPLAVTLAGVVPRIRMSA